MLSVSVVEVLWFWAISFGLFLVMALTTAVLIAAWSLGPSRSLFKGDLRHQIALKRRLPSGRRMPVFPYVVGLLLLDNGVQATLLYRVSHWLLHHHARPAAEALHAIGKWLTNIDCSPHAVAGPGLRFYHGTASILGKAARAGARLTVCQGASAGAHRMGDDVFIGANAVVLPSATIGDRSEIGALSFVKGDVPPDVYAVGIPATKFFPRAPSPLSEMESQSEAASGAGFEPGSTLESGAGRKG